MAKKHSNKKKHTSVNYSKMKVSGFLKFLALVLPLISYVMITTFVFPSPNSGFISLGIIGSFIFGLGLVNITGHLDDSNLGYEISVITCGLGSIMIGISSAIMYIPAIYSKIDEQQVSFYFLTWTVILVAVILYAFFRSAMKRYMRNQGVSKSRIGELFKGKANFWLYNTAHASLNLKWMYHINKLFIISFLIGSVVHLFLGWSRFFSPFIALLAVVILTSCIPMWSLVISTWSQGSSAKKNTYNIGLYLGYLLPLGAIAATILYTFATLH